MFLNVVGHGKPSHAKLLALLDSLLVNVMVVDPDELIIRYVNQQSRKTLKEIEHLLPCKAADIEGQCIDIFHKDPSHQRRILKDPKNLPFDSTIQLGEHFLDLHVEALMEGGNYTGAVLSWTVSTSRIAAENQAKTHHQMLDQMPINIMLCDPESLKITYVNETSLKTLKQIEHLLPVKIDQLMGTCIDIFHKNPSHQRKLLADAKNLPHRARISLGEHRLDLKVVPIFGVDGHFDSAMLTWEIVTERENLANDFEQNIKTVGDSVSSSATELQETAETMAETAEEANSKASVVASAAEQLSASVQEIASQMARSNTITQDAVGKAETVSGMVEVLDKAATEIGNVVELIRDVAEQTNLLALNATIEAARAGDAGKGFAVVASEVKNLAQQTGNATEEISAQITSIQNTTKQTVDAITAITRTISEISQIASGISSAVEEQGAATQEVAQNISGVTTAVSRTGNRALQTSTAANELSSQADLLSSRVDAFLKQVRQM